MRLTLKENTVKLKITAIFKEGKGEYTVWFNSKWMMLGIPDKSAPPYPKVNLSKSGINTFCNTSITNLQSHKMHTCTFYTLIDRREYYNRVERDVRNVINSYNIKINAERNTNISTETVC